MQARSFDVARSDAKRGRTRHPPQKCGGPFRALLPGNQGDFVKNVLIAACIAAACAVGLSANQTQTSDQKANAKDQWTRPISVTGCVQAGLTAGTFDLTGVKGLPANRAADQTSATGTSGTTGATTADSAVAKTDSRHLTEGAAGDQMSSGGAVSAGTQPTGGTTMTSGHGVGGGSGRSLRVSSVKMIAPSCSSGK